MSEIIYGQLINVIKVFGPTTVAFFIGIAITPILTHYLYKHKMWKKKAGKFTSKGEETPIFNQLHKEKEVGTPRLGGIIIWVSTLITVGLFWFLAIAWPNELTEKLNFLSRNQTWLPLFTLIAASGLGLIEPGVVRLGGIITLTEPSKMIPLFIIRVSADATTLSDMVFRRLPTPPLANADFLEYPGASLIPLRNQENIFSAKQTFQQGIKNIRLREDANWLNLSHNALLSSGSTRQIPIQSGTQISNNIHIDLGNNSYTIDEVRISAGTSIPEGTPINLVFINPGSSSVFKRWRADDYPGFYTGNNIPIVANQLYTVIRKGTGFSIIDSVRYQPFKGLSDTVEGHGSSIVTLNNWKNNHTYNHEVAKSAEDYNVRASYINLGGGVRQVTIFASMKADLAQTDLSEVLDSSLRPPSRISHYVYSESTGSNHLLRVSPNGNIRLANVSGILSGHAQCFSVTYLTGISL